MKTYTDSESGCTFHLSSRPSFIMKHIDGPVMVFRDGQMHWLTLWERLLVLVGRATPEKLERKRRPNLCRLLDSIPNPATHDG